MKFLATIPLLFLFCIPFSGASTTEAECSKSAAIKTEKAVENNLIAQFDEDSGGSDEGEIITPDEDLDTSDEG